MTLYYQKEERWREERDGTGSTAFLRLLQIRSSRAWGRLLPLSRPDGERWRLESFRSVRTYLQQTGLGAVPADELFMRLYEDLQKSVRFPGRAQMLQTLEADRELFDLLSRASAQERRPGHRWRAFFDALDPCWERPES